MSDFADGHVVGEESQWDDSAVNQSVASSGGAHIQSNNAFGVTSQMNSNINRNTNNIGGLSGNTNNSAFLSNPFGNNNSSNSASTGFGSRSMLARPNMFGSNTSGGVVTTGSTNTQTSGGGGGGGSGDYDEDFDLELDDEGFVDENDDNVNNEEYEEEEERPVDTFHDYEEYEEDGYTQDEDIMGVEEDGQASVGQWLHWLKLDPNKKEDEYLLKYAVRGSQSELKHYYTYDSSRKVYIDHRTNTVNEIHPKVKIYATKIELARTRHRQGILNETSMQNSDDETTSSSLPTHSSTLPTYSEEPPMQSRFMHQQEEEEEEDPWSVKQPSNKGSILDHSTSDTMTGHEYDAEKSLLQAQLRSSQTDLSALTSTLSNQLVTLHNAVSIQKEKHYTELQRVLNVHKQEQENVRTDTRQTVQKQYSQQILQLQDALKVALEQLNMHTASATSTTPEHTDFSHVLARGNETLDKYKEEYAVRLRIKEEEKDALFQQRLEIQQQREDDVGLKQVALDKEQYIVRSKRAEQDKQARELEMKEKSMTRELGAYHRDREDTHVQLQANTTKQEEERISLVHDKEDFQRRVYEREESLRKEQRRLTEFEQDMKQQWRSHEKQMEQERVVFNKEKQQLFQEREIFSHKLLEIEETQVRMKLDATTYTTRVQEKERQAEDQLARAGALAEELGEQARKLQRRELEIQEAGEKQGRERASFEYEYQESVRVLNAKARALERSRIDLRKEREVFMKQKEQKWDGWVGGEEDSNTSSMYVYQEEVVPSPKSSPKSSKQIIDTPPTQQVCSQCNQTPCFCTRADEAQQLIQERRAAAMRLLQKNNNK